MPTMDASLTYLSLADFADAAERNRDRFLHSNSLSDSKWTGGSLDNALTLAREGWPEGTQEAMRIYDDVMDTVRANLPKLDVLRYHDVAGSEVDVGAYVMGEPECMVEQTIVTNDRAESIITLCASIGARALVSADQMIRRGANVVALATAIEQTGRVCEIWADTTLDHQNGTFTETKIRVKGTHDVIDPDRVAYALSHPSMHRRLGWSAKFDFPENIVRRVGWNRGDRGGTILPAETLPEGTIYLPPVNEYAPEEGPELILDTLRTLGIIE